MTTITLNTREEELALYYALFTTGLAEDLYKIAPDLVSRLQTLGNTTHADAL